MKTYRAYIKSLDCRRTIWQSPEYKSEVLAERALNAAYKEYGYDPEAPNCNSDIEEFEEDDVRYQG